MPVTPEFAALYTGFSAPIAALDCGEKCAPYNERGVPFCCDTRHVLPSAYQAEWEYLQAGTNLWHEWHSTDPHLELEIHAAAPEGQVLIECLGHRLCQRGYRSIACRAFPFFPYLTREGEFIGLSYYWEYEDRCWVISHLAAVSSEYAGQFFVAFDALFSAYPDERETFRQQGIRMRRLFGRMKRTIPLLHRNGKWYKITPRSGRMRRLDPAAFRKFGPYEIAEQLPFPDGS